MRKLHTLTLTMALGAALLCTAGTATAGSDVTPPTLTVPKHASFPVGHQVPSLQSPGKFPVHYAWDATDESGICSASVLEYWGAGDLETFRLWRGNDSEVDLDVVQNNGSLSDDVMYHAIRVKDCAGNKTKQTFSGIPKVLSEQGWGYNTDYHASVFWSGQWTLHPNDQAYEGALATTSDPDAYVGYTLSPQDFGVEPGSHIGLVMPMGPKRGEVSVSIMNTEVARVDTYAPAAQARMVVADIEVPDGAINGSLGIVLKNVGEGVPSKISIDSIAIL